MDDASIEQLQQWLDVLERSEKANTHEIKYKTQEKKN